MESDYSQQIKSDINYLVTNYLESGKSLGQIGDKKENLLNSAKENLNFGQLYDIDLNTHNCTYDVKKEIFNRFNDFSLQEVYKNYLLGNNLIKESDGGKKLDDTFQNVNIFQKIKKLKFLPSKDHLNIKKHSSLNFKHMKSILGHIQIQDANLINPVPIYCMGYSNNGELFFTGDNLGLIKIWSSRTGAMVEVFKDHEKAINDLLVVDSYLISCSEDMSVIIWDTEKLEMVKSLQFDEPIQRVVVYEKDVQIKNTQLTRNLKVIIASSQSGKNYLFDLNAVLIASRKKANKEIDDDEDNINLINISKYYFDKKILEKYFIKKNKSFLNLKSTAVGKTGLQIIGFQDGLICVWDIERIVDDVFGNRKQLYDFEKYLLFLEYVHNNITHFLEFNKQNTQFFSGSVDGNILIWKINEDVIKNMRKGTQTMNKYDKDYLYPVVVLKKINEDDKVKTRCSINTCCWTNNSNYIICLISSKNKKKIHTNSVNNNINANNLNNNPNSNSTQTCKRSSSMLIYDANKEYVIKRLDEENNFNFHDEVYVLEPHPVHEEIVLTVLNTSEVILLNFITNEILCKFTEENYFFNNIPTNILTTEAKFSSQGDMFVVSTYLGSISIYSIYSKFSYSGTYMNQFFEDENNKYSNIIYPKYCNMFNLPYVIQQPYSKYKIDSFSQVNKENFNIMQKSYYYDYNYNYNERLYECEREERIFLEAAKENLTYRLQDQSEREDNNSAINDDGEYNQNDARDESFVGVPDEEMEYEDLKLDNSEMEEIEPLENENSEDEEASGSYNLRSKKKKKTIEEDSGGRRRSGRRSRQNNLNNNIESEFINENEKIPDEYQIESEFELENNDYTPNGCDNQITGRSMRNRKNRGSDGNDILSQSARRLGRRKRLKIKMNRNRITEEEDFNSNHNLEENDYKIIKSSKIIEDDSTFNNLNESMLLRNIEECKEIEEVCFICKKRSKSLIGPFCYEVTNNKSIYIHLECLVHYNDFEVYNPSTKNLNIEKTIIQILEVNHRCFRCNGDYATKKCFSEECDRYFHGHYCLNKFCVEYKKSIYCLECYKKITIDKSKIQIKDFKEHYNFIYRNFLTKNNNSFYTYFPQIKDKVYFILQAYEDYLRGNFENIIYETEEIFFWKKKRIFKDNATLECEIVNIEYCFPNNMSIQLIQKMYKKDIYEKLKLIIKLELKVLNEYECVNEDNNLINIIFFENNLPDFLINKITYDANQNLFEKNVKEDSENYFDIVMADGVYRSKLLNEEARESNPFFQCSPFENLIFTSDSNENEKENTFRVSFWDIQNDSLKKDYKLLKLLDTLKNNIEEFYSKNEKTYYLFYDTVDEKRDQAENYYTIIPVSIGLKLIIERLGNGYYNSTESIEYDLDLIVKNSTLYNGDKSKITTTAKKMVQDIKNIIETHNVKNDLNTPEEDYNQHKFQICLNSDTNKGKNGKAEENNKMKNKRLLSQIQLSGEIDIQASNKIQLRSCSKIDNLKNKRKKYLDRENENLSESYEDLEQDSVYKNSERTNELIGRKRSKRSKKN